MADQSNGTTLLLLTGYEELGKFKLLYFLITLVAFTATVFVNVCIIALICVMWSLHKPMYILMCNLFINALYGSFAIYPQILSNFFLQMHFVRRDFCQLQIFFIQSFASIECTILAAMAFDRYVSICLPLRYHTIMTTNSLSKLLALTWLLPVLLIGVLVGLTSKLPLCSNIIEKPYCDNWSVVKLSCVQTTKENLYGSFVIVCIPGIPVILILLSYQKILSVCMRASKESREKALHTCVPHITSCVTYCINILFEVITNRLDSLKQSPLRISLALVLLILPTLLNPLIYGFQLSEIRMTIMRVLTKERIRL